MSITLDFHIHQEEKTGYQLTVKERGSSEALATCPFKYNVDYATQFEVNRLGNIKDVQERFEEIRKFGEKLYELLFTDEVKTLWQTISSRGEFVNLCLRFADNAIELSALPWETLYDGEEFLAAGLLSGVTRLPESVEPKGELEAVPAPYVCLR